MLYCVTALYFYSFKGYINKTYIIYLRVFMFAFMCVHIRVYICTLC